MNPANAAHRLLLMLLGAGLLATGVATRGQSQAGPRPGPTHLLPIAELRTWLGPRDEPVTIRGVLTRVGEMSFVQDSSSGVMVRFRSRPRLRVGDEVEITGLPVQQLYGSELLDASARLLWAGASPPASDVSVGQAARGDFDNELIELTATLDGIDDTHGAEVRLRASDDSQQFIAMFEDERRELSLPKLQLRSRVRFRGICSMSPSLTHNVVPFVLLLRSGDDAQQLAGPPWWTPALILRDGLVALCLVLAVWIVRIRIRSSRERALQEEREHIAHELHDTLAQSFAGVAFQLQAVKSNLPDDAAQLTGHVEMALSMVRYSHQEARRSIATLRDPRAAVPSIAGDIKESVHKMIGAVPLQVSVEVEGIARETPLRVSSALLRVAQEAAANALRHSDASTLAVRLRFSEAAVELEVRDDGRGFDPKDNVRSAGFGLTGMVTRMRKIGGTLKVHSASGRGTVISAWAPLASPRRWQLWKEGAYADSK